MKSLIDSLLKLVEKFEAGRGQLDDLDALESRLRSEESVVQSQLAGLGPEQLAAGTEGTDHFDESTRRKLRSLSDIQTKLGLLPGVRSRQQAGVAALRSKLKPATDALTRHCGGETEEKLKALHAKLTADLAPICGKGTERLKDAVLSIVLKSDLEQWRLAFSDRQRANDPVEAAMAAIALAEEFQRGGACPHAVDQTNEVADMVAKIGARGRF
jgi:hypothetical protein